jgi:hypothetical protein
MSGYLIPVYKLVTKGALYALVPVLTPGNCLRGQRMGLVEPLYFSGGSSVQGRAGCPQDGTMKAPDIHIKFKEFFQEHAVFTGILSSKSSQGKSKVMFHVVICSMETYRHYHLDSRDA